MGRPPPPTAGPRSAAAASPPAWPTIRSTARSNDRIDRPDRSKPPLALRSRGGSSPSGTGHTNREKEGPTLMRTRLTELLGIEHPVMLAGMGGVSYSELVSAVSAAGGFGCLGASTMGNEKMAEEIAAVRNATDKPFGVDLLTDMPGGMSEQVQLIIDGGASAFVAGLGVPSEVVDLCHRNGVIVVSMCGKVEHAVRAVDAG